MSTEPNFDTQKAPKMKETLQTIADYITSLTGLATRYYVCAFYATTIDSIYHGLKRAFAQENIITGRQFCQMLEIEYEIVLDKAVADQADNLHYFLHKAAEIKANTNADPPRCFDEPGGLLTGTPPPGDGRQLKLFSGGCR